MALPFRLLRPRNKMRRFTGLGPSILRQPPERLKTRRANPHKGNMGHNFASLCRRQSAVHRLAEMKFDLGDISGSHQAADRDKTSIPGSKCFGLI
ncbi:hypothetical protein FHT97_004271 [Rhizobium sp. BK399]|nr:hypothetical protein [Rhizobium sp. BK399]